MFAHLLRKIRKDQHLSKKYISQQTDLDQGFLSHVENSERLPSNNTLKKICSALDVPYQQLLYTYDKTLKEEHIENDFLKLVPYNSIVAVESFDNLIKCPAKFGGASFAVRITDNSMEPKYLRGSYAFVEQNTPLSSRDFGLFYYNGNFLIRKFIVSPSTYWLKPLNPSFESIAITKNDEFYAIGKILGTTDDF